MSPEQTDALVARAVPAAMSPERFHELTRDFGVTSEDVSLETRSDHLGGAWVAVARIGSYEREAAVFAPTDVFSACHWLAQLRRLEEAARAPGD